MFSLSVLTVHCDRDLSKAGSMSTPFLLFRVAAHFKWHITYTPGSRLPEFNTDLRGMLILIRAASKL